MTTLEATAHQPFHCTVYSPEMEARSMQWKSIDTSNERVRARFDGYVDRRSEAECWLWLGTRVRSGHGQLWDGTRNIAAHRYALAIAGAEIGDALVCHRCNTPACVNPAHLYAGTYQTNSDDAVAAGAIVGNPAPRGEKNYMAILTAQQVAAVRLRYVPRSRIDGTRAMARELGVSQAAISKVVRGLTWQL